MKLSISVLAIFLGCAVAAGAAAPGALTTLHAIHSLSNADAGKGLPVAFEATVTYYNKGDIDLFVQDGDEAVYVETRPNLDIELGDRVLIRGKTRKSFRPDVVGSDVTRVRPGNLPAAVPAGFEQLLRADLDCRRVTVHGIVRSLDRVLYGTLPEDDLKLLMDGGYIDVTVLGGKTTTPGNLLDAEVEITGDASGIFDSKNQLTGVVLEVPRHQDIKILKRAATSLDSLPVTPMDSVLSAYYIRDLTRRVRVQGTITYYQPGSAVVLQSGAKSLWLNTRFHGPLRVGNWADATGFPEVSGMFLTLNRTSIQDSQVQAPVTPLRITGSQLAAGTHAFDLVSVEGLVVMSAREAAQDEYVLSADGKAFSAIYRHPEGADSPTLAPMPQIPVGSKVLVTGICMLQNGSDPFHGPVAVDVLLRSFADVQVIAKPTFLSVRHLAIAVVLMLVLVLLAGARGWTLERKMRRHTSELAYTERRRSRILEEINGARPLAEVIEQITELVSFRLRGAPCWCQIADGALLGNCPEKPDSFRVVEERLPSRSGPPLGSIFAALDPLTVPRPIESEALSMGAALCTLAIETRRLYTDLRHRSEFDLLTDTHNRFSLDKHLDSLIAEARQNAAIFGLIYIDLNEFKQINDLYGHHVGDLYLQETAIRMKNQLRTHDLLARQGGDEFAALVPEVRSRAEVEEIAQRLERSFDEPFFLEGFTVRGAASVGIALYPQDGDDKESLLNKADAAMYSAKNARRQIAGTITH